MAMKQAERMAAVRNEAVEKFVNFGEVENFKVGVGTFVAKTENGWAKVTVQAVKDGEFDAEQAKADYEFDMNERATKAAKRKAEAEAKKAADVAKKAAAKAKAEAKA